MFTNWKRNADKETRLNPLSIEDIDALTIATLRGMGTTPERFRQNVSRDMPEDALEQGEKIIRRNPKVRMPKSHFKLQGAQEEQMMDEMELNIPEFHFDEGLEESRLGVKQMARDESTQRAINAYKNTYKDHVMQAFDKHKAFMQSLGNQPMTVQEFMQHPKVPSFADYYKQANEGTIPGGDYAEAHPFAITHPKEYIDHRDGTGDTLPPIGMEGLFGPNNDPFIPVITGEPMDLAMDALLKQGRFENAAQRRIYSEIPSFEDYGLGLKDVPTMRIMPVEDIESKGVPTFFKPKPLGGKGLGDPEPFEREKAMRGAKHVLDLPDVRTVGGTWGYPLNLSAFAPEGKYGPDVNLGVGNNVTLGILDVPDWFAGQEDGRDQPEGYQIGGFDKDAYVRLDDSLGVPAIAPRWEWFDSARRISPVSNFPGHLHRDTRPRIGDDLTGYGYQPVYNLLSQFPVTTIDDLRDPISGYGPRNLDFQLEDWEDAKVASEPMDLAMDALLKRDFDSWEVHPGENQYKHNYKMPNPDSVHPEWYDWLHEVINEPWEYEGIMDDYQQPDIDHLAGATSREDFFERLEDLYNFGRTDVQPLFDDVEGIHRDFTDVPWNEETGFTRSEPMPLAMNALLKNQPYHEMSKDQLDEILYGLGGYDVGTRKYSRDETSSTQEEKDAAFQELLARQREADANPVNVFNLDGEEKSRLVDFYEPQFTGQNISPDVFIPQTEEEGQAAFDGTALADDIDERLSDIDEFMPGKSFLTEEDPMGKYHHLRATAGDDVAQNYLNRYRDFAMRNSENPEYVHQRLMQMFDENQEVTAPQYTQEFPTDESIFNVKPPHVMMNEPDATGFAHNWQAKNASEPMNLAIDALLKREIHPGSLAAYRQMVEDLGDKMPVEQRIAQLLGEGKYLNHPKQFELHPARPTKQYDYHGNVENLEDVPILNEKLEPFKITDDGYPEHRNLSIYDKHNASPKRITYTPEILEREELPTFAGIPMNEKTGFTRSEPMALAIDALLKRELHPGPFSKIKYNYQMPDFELHPDWEKWTDEIDNNPYEYEGLGEDWTQNDIDYIAGSQSREEFLQRINEISNFQRNEDKHPNAMLARDYFDDYHFRDVPFNEETGFTRSEPMDLTIDALLKGEQHNEWFKEYYENNPIIPFFSIKDHRYLNEAQNRDDYFDRMNKLSEFHKDENKTEPSTDIQFPAGFQFSNKSEPMALAMDGLLKDLSPEAKRHKLEYDKKYESSPERVKYREELNRERRRRGIYGSGDHMDVSHTEGGKLTLEPEHGNRARHFKDKGTLRPSE